MPRTSWRLGVEKKLRFVKVYSANTAGEMVSPLSAPIRDAFALPTPTSLSFTDTNAATFSVAGLLELTGSTDPDVLRALALRGFEEFFGEVTTSIGPRATLAWASALALRASGSSQAPLVLWSLGVLPGRARSNYRLSGPKCLCGQACLRHRQWFQPRGNCRGGF